jgi:hypothetical protein
VTAGPLNACTPVHIEEQLREGVGRKATPRMLLCIKKRCFIGSCRNGVDVSLQLFTQLGTDVNSSGMSALGLICVQTDFLADLPAGIYSVRPAEKSDFPDAKSS